jgi:hypothetical protein
VAQDVGPEFMPSTTKLKKKKRKKTKKNSILSQALVAHACNPSYSRGRDQEDGSFKPPWANGSEDPISKKNPSQKKG